MAILGGTSSICTISNTQMSNAGPYAVTVSNTLGTVTSNIAMLTVNSESTGIAPVITQQPSSQTIASGNTVVFTATLNESQTTTSSNFPIQTASLKTKPSALATEATSVSYQWFWNGTAISGATDSTYVLSNATSANDGSYTCLLVNSIGSVMTSPATLNVVQASEPGHLINISCRANVGKGADILIAGFVVGGSGTSGSDQLLIRGSGPALASFGVTGVLLDPQLQLYQTNTGGNSTLLGSNNGWAGNASISSAAASVGAFAWTVATSHDSALVQTHPSGPYTAQIAGASGDTGVALAEVYDATPVANYTSSSPRLINISARVEVGTGGNILIAGFVIGGTTSKTVLIRGSGPALTPFGVPGVLPDPELALYQSNSDGTSTLLKSDLGWGGDTQIAATAASVGAFSWGTSATPDSAILITLPPGAYTAQVSGASGDTGVALVEVFEVQ